jgi:antitoxin (DNA-binding transcriptional repressor) of toxin-antitoxin stability system
MRNGKPVVRLTPVASPAMRASVPGIWRGQAHMTADFDGLPDDTTEA